MMVQKVVARVERKKKKENDIILRLRERKREETREARQSDVMVDTYLSYSTRVPSISL